MLSLNEREEGALLQLSRCTLESHFSDRASDALREFKDNWQPIPVPLLAIAPCFVTLFLNHKLRGCIGSTHSVGSLYLNVYEYTLHAAFRDPRFRPLVKKELEKIQLEITVIGDMRPLPSVDAIQIGKHGLSVKSARSHGVLLAQVAEQFCWSPKIFMEQTCIKAGLDPGHSKDYEFLYFDEQHFSEAIKTRATLI